jgi:hypothetical protein
MFLTVPGREYLTERALNGSLGKLENRRDISTGAKRKIWTLSHSSCAWWSPLQPYHPSSHLHRTLFQNFPHLAYCCLSSSLISLRFKATMEDQVGATSGGGTDAAAAHRCCRRPVARRRWRAALPLPWRVTVGSLGSEPTRRGGPGFHPPPVEGRAGLIFKNVAVEAARSLGCDATRTSEFDGLGFFPLSLSLPCFLFASAFDLVYWSALI